MKRLWCILLAVVMLILTACTPAVQQNETTVLTESTTAPTETTAPEETTDPDTLSAVDCLVDELPVMSYEEYFTEDRRFCIDGNTGNNRTWSYPYGDSYILCKADLSFSIGIIEVSSEAFENRYEVPCEKPYPEHSLIAADGKWAYLLDETEILQVDMHTGEVRYLVSSEKILQAYVCGRDLLYYSCVQEDKIRINRLYIPTMRTDCLYDDISSDVPWDNNGFYLLPPESTLGDIVWTTITPEMVALMKKELSDPDSPYREIERISKLWETEDPFRYDVGPNASVGWYLAVMMHPLEEKTGVYTYLEGTYSVVDRTYSERRGVVGSCCFNYNYDHDHFAPEITSMDDPVLNIGEWVDTATLTAPTELNTSAYPYWDVVDSDKAWSMPWFDIYNPYVLMYPDRFEAGQLYRNDGGIGERLTDQKLLGFVSMNSYIYGVTEENVLIKIDENTGGYENLYPAQNGRITKLQTGANNVLYFLDGDTLVQLDVSAQKVRTLIEHVGQLYDLKFREDYDDSNILCITMKTGLVIGNYRLNLQTGEVQETDDNIMADVMGY